MPGNGKDFSERLQRVMREGNLTVADLARWFERPHPTVRGWTRGGQLGGAPLDAAWVLALLDKVERKIRKKQGLPVPRMAPGERIKYLQDLRRSA